MELDDWFLTPLERGNTSSGIDDRGGFVRGWTEGNRVEVLIDGTAYFGRLLETSSSLERGDLLAFTDWQGDADERLVGPGTAIGRLLADLAGRGVHVRGLLWRSHPRLAHFGEEANMELAKAVDAAGGEVLLDERVRYGGSHHQKLVIMRRVSQPDDDVAFVGGIDLSHGRHDDSHHRGDEQAVKIDAKYGLRPPWHDVQLEVHGPAITDLEHSFCERWQDPTPLDHRNPWRKALRAFTRQPGHPQDRPWPARVVSRAESGPHAIQVLRTYPAKRPAYPFARAGERSIARAYIKAFSRARRLVYLEDQYLWSHHAAGALADALRRSPDLHVVAVVPRYPDRDGRLSGAASRIGRERAIEVMRAAGGDRVAIYDLENTIGIPIYVHAKNCIIDDVWMIAGSDNLNRRSWTHDSELSCSIIDSTLDKRHPADPAALGDGARELARETRLRLWREHLERDEDHDADLIDPSEGFAAMAASADALDAWHAGSPAEPRPPGHLRRHVPDQVPRNARWAAEAMYKVMLDPDGRPRGMRHNNEL